MDGWTNGWRREGAREEGEGWRRGGMDVCTTVEHEPRKSCPFVVFMHIQNNFTCSTFCRGFTENGPHLDTRHPQPTVCDEATATVVEYPVS